MGKSMPCVLKSEPSKSKKVFLDTRVVVQQLDYQVQYGKDGVLW